MTQNNRANTYRERIEGDRIANLDIAIEAYRATLEVRTPRKYPIESGRIQSQLEATIDLRDALIQRDRHNPELYSITVKTSIQWLLNSSKKIARFLGLDLENNTNDDNKEKESEHFFLKLLQAVVNSEGNGPIVHKFFDEHLRHLNENLLAILPQHLFPFLKILF